MTMFQISRQVLPVKLFNGSENFPPKIFTNESMKEPKNFRVFSKLGTGRHGSVYMAYHTISKEKYALKCKEQEKPGKKYQNYMQREIDTLKLLLHKNIITFHASFKLENYHFLVMDYMDGGDLLDDINRKGRYTESRAQEVSLGIVRALKHCHDNNIVHRDIKPDNILLDKGGNVKLADFSLSARMPDSNHCSLTTKCGTKSYVAPEMLLGCGYGTPVDMWGIGIVIYIMIGGYHPFETSNSDEINALIMGGIYSFHKRYWNDVSKDATHLISCMLTVNSEQRITAEDALKLPWFYDGHEANSQNCCGWKK